MHRLPVHLISALMATAALTATGFSHAADLTVAPGQTYTVGPAQSDLRLDHLTLGDNARITFAPGVSSWRVYAKQASIGQNVVIDGRGADGIAGNAGAERSGRAKACEEGRAGGNGGMGASGGNGVSMTLWWGVESLGSLAIQADGGSGGAGGVGGRGQEGGAVNRCTGASGGAGGVGGAGGNGGKGGDVVFSYFGKSAGDKIRISSVGGSAGLRGIGGAGGPADDGKFQRTTTGDRWFQGGQPGVSGNTGAVGHTGVQGGVQLDVAASNVGPAWRDEIGSVGAPTVAVLQQQVQALQANTAVTAPSGQSQSVPELLKQMQSRIDDLEQRLQILEKR